MKILLALLFVLLYILPVMAQDVSPTDAPSAATAEPVSDAPPINVDIPAATDNTPWSTIFNIALLVFIVIREIQHAGKVSLATVQKIIAVARGYADTTPGTADNTAVDLAEAIATALLNRQGSGIPGKGTVKIDNVNIKP